MTLISSGTLPPTFHNCTWSENMAYKTIDLTRQEFTNFEEFYSKVAGRCNNATLHVTDAQAQQLYHFFASSDDWKEPNLLPADYRVGAIQKIVVIEE